MTTEGFSTSPAIRLLPKIGKVIEYFKALVVYPFMRRTLLRTPEMWEKYEKNTAKTFCALCTENQPFSKYFNLRKQDTPYDGVAEKHVMLVLKRHVPNPSVTEWLEVLNILQGSGIDEWDCIRINTNKSRSIKGHFHIHLILDKELVNNAVDLNKQEDN